MKKYFILILFGLLFSTVSFATEISSSFQSQYTDLSHCKTIQKQGELLKSECPGLDEYKVYLSYEGNHSRLVLKKGPSTLDIFTQGNKVNSPIIAGPKLEWRYKGKKLVALIYRVAGENNSYLNKIQKALQVIRLEAENHKWCLLAEVDTNEEAQKIADSDKGCGGVSPFGLY